MQLNSLFSKHAVFQRYRPIPVWGSTTPRTRVRATLGPVSAETISNRNGEFIVRLPACPAGGPYTLTIENEKSTERLVVEDILVGEVWVCSGQSNMEWIVQNALPDPAPRDFAAIRMYTAPRVTDNGQTRDCNGAWKPALRENVADFSAVGYFFARRLHEALGVPIGMLNASWGGTRIEAWTSRQELARIPRQRVMLDDCDATLNDPSFWAVNSGAFGDVRGASGTVARMPADPGNTGAAKGWARPDFDDSSWITVKLPSSCCAFDTPNNGSFWFRKTVDIPRGWRGRDLALGVGSIDKHDVTYVNGEEVGATGRGEETQYWNLRREYIVPARLTHAATLSVAVRVFSFIYDTAMNGPAMAMFVRPLDEPSATPLSLAGNWKAIREHDIGLTQAPPAPMGADNPNTPHILFDSMIAPLLPYAIRGVIWYQGESNAGNAREYAELLQAMIRDWRRAWTQGDFPFISVQLASWQQPKPYDGEAMWPFIREAMLNACRLANVGTVSAVDVGDATDIHPPDKRTVGLRLAQWALVNTYGQPGVAMGPRFVDYSVENAAIRLRFDHLGKGLVAKDGSLATFYVAGANRKFEKAHARIEGDTVVVSSSEVKTPVACRYAWADHPEGANLYNADGLPASPFRTDFW